MKRKQQKPVVLTGNRPKDRSGAKLPEWAQDRLSHPTITPTLANLGQYASSLEARIIALEEALGVKR